MSKLDNILIEVQGYIPPATADIESAKRKSAKEDIKALMLELIGETHGLAAEGYYCHEDELRRKVEEL